MDKPDMDNLTVPAKKIKEGFVGQKMIVLPHHVKKAVIRDGLTKRFHLTAIGYYPHAGYHDRERKTGSSQYILLYCVKGRGNIFLQHKHIQLQPNSFFIIPKNIPHRYASSVTDPWSIYWVHFAGEHADLIYQQLQEKEDRTNIPHDERIIMQFEEIYHLLDGNFNTRLLEIASIKLQHFIASFVYSQEISLTSSLHDPIQHSVQFMKDHLNCALNIEELAKQQRLSVSHYCRLFRSRTGSSPNQYFNQLKIQKSCQYLYFTDMHIKEICTAVGFDDPFYFSRLFKKLMGVSPSSYKSQYKQY
jgi:AraC-like DNA-binding protein